MNTILEKNMEFSNKFMLRTRMKWILYDVLNKYQYRNEFVLNDVYNGNTYRI